MQRLLSFEQTPPISVPLRFFLTAPLFAVLAAALLLWHGPAVLASRWSPFTLAFTHFLTIGFLSMTMIGALMQIVQVVAGIEVFRARLTATVAHALLTIGCLLLCAGFISARPVLFKLALPCLLLAFFGVLASCAVGMWRTVSTTATFSAIRLSLAALAITALLGALAASAFAWPLQLPLVLVTNLHAGWGLLAWVGLLVAGVAYQVVPMFQITEIYPAILTRRLAGIVFALLALWSAATLWPSASGWPARVPQLLIAAGYLAFGGVTLHLLWRRKRPKPEATTLFWYLGMASLLACILLWLLAQTQPGLAQAAPFAMTLGILFIVGFAYSVINGMLYKIVPFLVWYHLQHRIIDRSIKAPNVRQIISERAASGQFNIHLTALALLSAACWQPALFTRAAAGVFGASSCWLLLNLLHAARIYRTMARRVADLNGNLQQAMM